MNDRDVMLSEIAGQQYQLWSREQAQELGFPRQTIYARQRSGRWIHVSPNVYGTPGVPPAPERRLMAATLGLRSAVVTHQASAWLHDVQYAGSPRLAVAVPLRTTHRYPYVDVHESSDLVPEHTTVVRGLPTTTVERCLADLAGTMQPGRMRRITQDVLGRQLATWEQLRQVQRDLQRRGKRGMGAYGEMLVELGPGLALELSALESEFLRGAQVSGLPMPIVQFHLPWRDTPAGHVDFAWLEEQFITEVDGRRWHTRDEAWDEDIRREAEASEHGWQLQRFSWKQVVHDWAFVERTVRSRLRQRLVRI
jgi:hypothetical protein